MGYGFISWLRSNENEIISLLQMQGDVLVKSVNTLVELIDGPDRLQILGTKIEDLEHEGDKITHKIFVLLDKTFVTPLDKEDISELAGQVDQVNDYTDRFVGTLNLFEINELTVYMKELIKMLLSSAQEIYFLVKKLHGFKNSKE